jgi:legumain
VIAAGSNGYANYRHQADACRAYHIARNNGVPADHIILMMMDDVAHDKANPYPGQLFNLPTADGTPGRDVYEGCVIDYRGTNVTGDPSPCIPYSEHEAYPPPYCAPIVSPQLFLDVLLGNADAAAGLGSGKVLQSGPNDNVFVNFVDHGGNGGIFFPGKEMPQLTATELHKALRTMHAKQMYNKLVFYVEACQSGSMFYDILDDDINVFAVTSADTVEPSWGTYCPPQDTVNGQHIGACLGDMFSLNWMADSETSVGMAGTLHEQFVRVQNVTTAQAHRDNVWASVSEYGTVGVFDVTDKVAAFQAHGAAEIEAGEIRAGGAAEAEPAPVPVDSRDIDLVTTFYKYLRAREPAANAAAARVLRRLIQARERADAVFPAIVTAVQQGLSPHFSVDRESIHACRDNMYAAVNKHCGGFDSYSLRYSRDMGDLCKSFQAVDIKQAVARGCHAAHV